MSKPQVDLLPSEIQLAQTIAKKATSLWKSIENEDATSHLYLWLTKNHRNVLRYREEEFGLAKLTLSLKRECNDYCVKETKIKNGGHLEDHFAYSKEQIRRSLPYIWELDSWSQTTVYEKEGKASTGINNQIFDNALAMLSDISSAYSLLDNLDKEILALKYNSGYTAKEIAQKLNVGEKIAQKRINTAVGRLYITLNSEELD